jgi:hypothetical protein
MSELRTKQQILEGTKATESVYIDQIDSEVEIKPLTDGRWARVQEVATQGLRMVVRKGGRETELDAGRSAVNNHNAQLLTCRMGLVEDWTDAELDRLPAGSVKAISNAIKRLSGIADDEDEQEVLNEAVKSFRDLEGGPDDSLPPLDGPPSDE